MVRLSNWKSLLDYLPRGGTLDEADWQRRHRFLQLVLLAHIPVLAVVGLVLGNSPLVVGVLLLPLAGFLLLGHLLPGRRPPAIAVTTGLVYAATVLVVITAGSIEAHFHFFVIIGFIAIYQDWAPFLVNITLTVLMHGVGSAWRQDLIFSHAAGQASPWTWSVLHGSAVLAACIGMTMFWRYTEDSQNERNTLAMQLADAEIGRRKFTSDLLVNLARRNQTMLYRQLDIINQLEESERDPDALAELFRLDHLTTRVRRNAENLLVLSGEQPPRMWREPVPLRDVVRAAIAETEDLERVAFTIDEHAAVAGNTVTDLTHLLAELTENAVRFSPPDTVVTIRTRRATARRPDGVLLTIEDWGVGMPPDELAAANALLSKPAEVDLSVAQRLGFHVVARLAARHGIAVSLDTTPGSGITAVVHLPQALLEEPRGATRHGDQGAEIRPSGREVTEKLTLAPASGFDPDHALSTEFDPVLATAARPAFVEVGVGEGSPGDGQGNSSGWTGWWEARSVVESVPAPRSAEPSEYRRSPEATRPSPAPAVPSPAPPPAFPSSPAAWDAEPVAHNGRPHLSLFVPPEDDAAAVLDRGAPVGPGQRTAGPVRRPVAEGPDATVQGLRRRVPQASLAPELRREDQPADDAHVEIPAQEGPPRSAASALSRYQASRRSAEAVVNEEIPPP
ncbi:MAG: sensor histidine kinase [Pseudonocardia sp.]